MTFMNKVLSVNKAIMRARKRVSIIHFGRDQFVVQEWCPDVNATRQSHHMDWHRACSYAKEARIRAAFEALGYHAADYPSWLHEEEGSWDKLIREYLNAPRRSWPTQNIL
jgi:hypothetical protein